MDEIKFSTTEIEARRARVAEGYLRGRTQASMAREEGVSDYTIHMDLKEIRERWVASSIEDISKLTAQEIKKIDMLEMTYWDQFERSKITAQQLAEAQEKGIDLCDIKGDAAGDPKYLQGIQWCIGKRISTLGLDAGRGALDDLRKEKEEKRLEQSIKQMDDERFSELVAAAMGSKPGQPAEN